MQAETRNRQRHSLQLLGVLGLAAALPLQASDTTRNWSGLSIGMTLGSSKTKADIKFDLPAAYVGELGSAPQIDAASLVSLIAPASMSERKFSGELQVGYNRQSGHLVWGGLVGLVVGGMKAEQQVSGVNTSGPLWAAQVNTSVESAAMLALRPKIGYATGKVLIFATGGLAVARLKVAQSHHQILNSTEGGYGLEVSETKTKLGWTAGCGIDYALSPKWALRGEFLHTRLGKISTKTLTTDEGNWSPGFPVAGETFRHEFKVRSESINLGVSYKF